MKRRRESQRLDDELLEPIVAPRIEAQTAASRLVLDDLQRHHRYLAEETDLDLVADTRSSAIWLLSGQCLGLTEAVWVQVAAGIGSQALITGRSIHEATRALWSFRQFGEDELLELWLADEGKHDYVKPGAARQAEVRFEEKLAEAMREEGLQPLEGNLAEKSAEMYDKLSRVAHNRRSACVDSTWAAGREMSYGRVASPLRRAEMVEWASSITIEVVLQVGNALEFFYGPGFHREQMLPLRERIMAVREAAPLDPGLVRRLLKRRPRASLDDLLRPP